MSRPMTNHFQEAAKILEEVASSPATTNPDADDIAKAILGVGHALLAVSTQLSMIYGKMKP